MTKILKKSSKSPVLDVFSGWIESIPTSIISKIAKIDELNWLWISGASSKPDSFQFFDKVITLNK